METGSELSKTVAIFIVQKILLDDMGLNYICQTYERFYAVGTVLSNMVVQLQESQTVRLLKHVVRCFLRYVTSCAFAAEAKEKKASRCLDALRYPQIPRPHMLYSDLSLAEWQALYETLARHEHYCLLMVILQRPGWTTINISPFGTHLPSRVLSRALPTSSLQALKAIH
jgi:hypothetical protein